MNTEVIFLELAKIEGKKFVNYPCSYDNRNGNIFTTESS